MKCKKNNVCYFLAEYAKGVRMPVFVPWIVHLQNFYIRDKFFILVLSYHI